MDGLMLNDLGQPDELEADTRAGFAAIWGSRKTGEFTVARGPVDTTYEVVLMPCNGGTPNHPKVEKYNMTRDELNNWLPANKDRILSVLRGE